MKKGGMQGTFLAAKNLKTGQLPQKKITSWLVLGFGLGLRLEFGLGAIFLGGNCPRTACELILGSDKF